MSKNCDACLEIRELIFFRILNKDTNERDTKCNYCIPNICSKCPIDPNTMKDVVKCLNDFRTHGFNKITKCQNFYSICKNCQNFRDVQHKKGVELSRTEFKTYNGVPMRICKGEKCDGRYVPLDNFNIMTNNPNTYRKTSNFQYRCIECAAKYNGKQRGTEKNESSKKRHLKSQEVFEQNKERKPNDPSKKRYCIHGIAKSQCKECPDGGASICPCGKQRNYCSKCGGNSLCAHGIRRGHCKQCQTIEELQKNRMFCNICGVNGLSKKRRKTQVCRGCEEHSIDRTEIQIRNALKDLVPPPSGEDDTIFGQTCDVVKKRRPDLIWINQDRVVIGEVDENGGHGTVNYTPECDFGWVMDMSSALIKLFQTNNWNEGKMPHIFVIRMNPDECDTNPKPLKDRIQLFADRINYYCTCSLDEYEARVPNIEYHFYHTKCYKHIEYAKEHSNAANVLQ
tara:strand:+ start:349 stop:1707 length:1359 start_codon:yes stop_codon:yes gene_type:complete